MKNKVYVITFQNGYSGGETASGVCMGVAYPTLERAKEVLAELIEDDLNENEYLSEDDIEYNDNEVFIDFGGLDYNKYEIVELEVE